MTGLDGGGIRAASGGWWGMGSAAGPARMPLGEYAAAIAARELILDETGIRVVGRAITGDIERAWALLTEHAARFGVAMCPGNLERTNRVLEWDELILGDALTQETWRRAYPVALAGVIGLPMEQGVGVTVVRHLEKQPSLLWNPFVPLALRRPAVTGELRAFAQPSLPPPRRADAAVFPGERLPNLVDFARLQHALQGGDFMGTLYKEGLDPVAFARICERWSKRLASDPALRAEYAALVERSGAVAAVAPVVVAAVAPVVVAAVAPAAAAAAVADTEPLPPQDTLVFPGQKLARVSDFARVSRAAKRGDFKAALAQAGVDADTFANACARFNARMQVDAVVAAQFARLLEDPRIDGAPSTG